MFLKMLEGNRRMIYPVIGFASCIALLFLSFGDIWVNNVDKRELESLSFVKRNGTHFTVDDKIFYVSGWNSYWLMDQAVEESSRPRVNEVLQIGAKMGLSVCRTWAFNDGTYNALQISHGQFDERVFKALDHVIAEARRQRIRLLLSLVNNLQAFGGKAQYVKWAYEEGVSMNSTNDSFFFNPSIRHYFKNYIKAVLTRRNTITGIEYRNDPTIFAWELMNEPRCMSDPSGETLQDWIEEMSIFVKSIDKNHLLTVGLEGFYGSKSPKGLTMNPGPWAGELGSDFIRNSNISTIDFTTVHIYPDQWFNFKLEIEEKMEFVSKWMDSHIEDGDKELNKPVVFTEFGLSNLSKGFRESDRERLYKTVLDIVYKSALGNKSGAGAFAWQFLVRGMEKYNDDFGFVPAETSHTYQLMSNHSCKLALIQGSPTSRRVCLTML
ncbi:mannan endo-1,4-beta-mannosidase 2-like [Impatiens glandulifera]|uniref:mannan endo-1,4-beta-mannosidase 2-like n=1 Tax=Impatiens glandulifera TaxID=253017 RepID=UPI001FB08A22|nr:mannan endo-1,4-beta-mannosidase 2-like [Impatiens glandulifera]